jgi:hypothetical protein
MIGGHAVAAHGHPRLTEDFDVFVEASVPNARRLGKSLAEFGFAAHAREWKWMSAKDRVLMLGRKPMRIDVLTSISGVSFETAWRGRVAVEIEGLRVPTIGVKALLANKRAANRPKDQLDVIELEELIRAASRSRRRPRRRAAGKTRTPGTRRR